MSDALVPRVSDELEQWLGRDQPYTLGNIVELSGPRSFALIIVLLMALPTGGATHVLEVVTMLVALQLLVGLCALSGASTLGYPRRLLRTRSTRPSASDRRSRGSCICRRAAAMPPPPFPRIEPSARGRRALRFCAEAPHGSPARQPALLFRSLWMAHVDPRAPSGFAIRPATKADGDAVAAVLLAAAEEAWSSFLGRERIIEANRGRAHRADLVAVNDAGIFGFVAWDVETGEITRLYVHPRGQRRGAGRALLGQALEALAAAGRRQAWLNTEHRNAGARRFYTREGWVEQGPPRRRNWHGAELVEPRYVKAL